MQSYRNYDYRKIFFRRPYWTELNILFLKSLLVSIFIILPLLIIFVNYYNQYPNDRIRYQLKQNYFVQIVKFYENKSPKAIEAKSAYITEIVGDIVLPPLDTEVDTTIEATIPDSVFEKPVKEDDSEVAAFGTAPSRRSSIQNAINSIQSAVAPGQTTANSPVSPYIARKKTYDSNTRKLNKENEEIGIPGTEFTDFDIVSGFRNQDEAIAVANENKKFVRHCIDKVYRNDPTLRGQMVIKFDVHPEGYAIGESIRVLESDIEDPRIMQCIKRSIRRWRNFPKVTYEMGNYSITQKYVF